MKNAWDILIDMDKAETSKNAGVSFNNEGGYYTLRSFGMDFSIYPSKQEIRNIQPEGDDFLKKYAYFFNLSALCYITRAINIPVSGKLVKPANLRGGDIFFKGSHVLPLDRLAEKYGDDKGAFMQRGKTLGGKALNYGDASVGLYPFPRIPVTLILWLSDEEFPSRADILFDSTCEQQLPLDIIWAVAMMSILVMM